MCSDWSVFIVKRTFENILYVNDSVYDYTPKNENDLVSNRHFDDFHFSQEKSIFFFEVLVSEFSGFFHVCFWLLWATDFFY